MNDLSRQLAASKVERRRQLAARPVGEKLQMLESRTAPVPEPQEPLIYSVPGGDPTGLGPVVNEFPGERRPAGPLHHPRKADGVGRSGRVV